MENASDPTYVPQSIVRIMTTASFEHPDTKISSTALKASIEYLRVFTREAIWRSEENRRTEEELDDLDETSTGNTDSATKVLNVKHLEKIAPNLVLDF